MTSNQERNLYVYRRHIWSPGRWVSVLTEFANSWRLGTVRSRRFLHQHAPRVRHWKTRYSTFLLPSVWSVREISTSFQAIASDSTAWDTIQQRVGDLSHRKRSASERMDLSRPPKVTQLAIVARHEFVMDDVAAAETYSMWPKNITKKSTRCLSNLRSPTR